MTKWLVIFSTWCAALAAQAAPFTPVDEAQVLERLREGPQTPKERELRSLRAKLNRDPRNLDLALDVARRSLERGAVESDPRFTGRAQSALTPWWSVPEPPEPVLVLRATIAQRNHDFQGALRDLASALSRSPHDPQAWITQAAVQQAIGDYTGARRSCLQVLTLTTRLVGATCVASVDALTGSLASSRALLAQLIEQDAGPLPEADRWALTALAEMDVRAGDATGAETAYRRALALGNPDGYLLASYADFLLDQGRAAEVVPLLARHARADNLLLRLAIAERRLGSPDAATHTQALRDRFAASRLRGDSTHAREEARFLLELAREPTAALPLAVRNFGVQREPADVRVLLDAALQAGSPSAARPALEFIAQNHQEDRELDPLRARLGGIPR